MIESRIAFEMPLRSGGELVIRKWGGIRILEIRNSEVYLMQAWLDQEDWKRFVNEIKKVE